MEYNNHLTSQNSNSTLYPQIINKKSPNCPLVKPPYIRMKIEGKNLEKSLMNANLLSNYDFNNTTTPKTFKNNINLNPYVTVTLNNQKIISKSICHNSPKWLEDYEFEINNNKTDKIIIEINSNPVKSTGFFENEKSSIYNLDALQSKESIYLGFQILPIKYLEKQNKIGQTFPLWLRLINKKQEEYFVKDSKHVLNIENHDPDNYKIDESLIKSERDSKIL